jgi:hypothetical protein
MTDIIIIYQTEEQIEGLTVTPPQIDGTDRMSLCRCEALPYGVTVLGTYEEVFADAEKKAIYDRIYPPTYNYTDEYGETIEVKRPEKFGVFA